MEFASMLTADEHRTAFELGASLKLAEAVTEKKAAWNFFSDTVAAGSKAGKLATFVSIALGVPIGIGAHWATTTAKKQTAKERELVEKTRMYRQTAEELERRLF